MTSLTLDFGDYFLTSGASISNPTIGAASTLTDVGSIDCTLNLTWASGGALGNWKELFAFKTDSYDLSDTTTADPNVLAADMVMDICQNHLKWASSINLFDVKASNPNASGTSNNTVEYSAALTGDVRNAGPAGTGGVDLAAGHTTIAKDYVRAMAKDIFAREGAADLFNNEATLASEASAIYGTSAGFSKKILDKFTGVTADTGSATTQVLANPLYVIMSNLLAHDAGARFTASTFTNAPASGGYKVAAGKTFKFNTTAVNTTTNQYYYMPLKVDDKISFVCQFDAVAAAGHGIGTNNVALRKYKIILTLA
jgi:hypothetical protein